MAPNTPARNNRGQFVSQDKEVLVTTKKATAVKFAAAALTYIAKNPDLYPEDWSAGAKTNKTAIIMLANKVGAALNEKAL